MSLALAPSRLARALPLALLLAIGAVAASPALAGPPWISIELPASPYDRTTRGAFLLVHAFHHGAEISYPVSGTAEGLVRGERRSVPLRFETTSRTGVYALRKQWPTEGVWTLVITVTQERNDVAQALVELSADGTLANVRVPTREQRGMTLPRTVTLSEVEQGLRARASRVAVR